jgi:hypothetical protein
MLMKLQLLAIVDCRKSAHDSWNILLSREEAGMQAQREKIPQA